ncbi:MAG: alanine racemase, partial [Pseudomonadota bacterium]
MTICSRKPAAHGPWAEIDRHALGHNLEQVRALAPGQRLWAVIKADGYGHGLLTAAAGLDQADGFAVARLPEALQLRAAGMRHPILLLEGVCDSEGLAIAAQQGLEVVLHHWPQVEWLCQAPPVPPVTVWIKMDSGMHRLGFSPAVVPEVLARLEPCPGWVRPPRFLSHLASADDREDPFTSHQYQRLQTLPEIARAELSLANSAGLLGHPGLRHHGVRPGLMLYGISPFAGQIGQDHGLRPVMTLKA